jgi:hypothetical protein
MAGNALVGNMNTAWMLDYFSSKQETMHLNKDAFQVAERMADRIFHSID